MATSESSFDYPELFRERPYIYAVLNEHATAYCHYCLKSSKAEAGKKLLRCSACTFAHYCDQQCQRAAWPDHKPECKYLKKMGPDRFPSLEVRLLSRMIFKHQQQYIPDERLPKDLQQQRPTGVPNRPNYLTDPVVKSAFKNGHWKELQEYCGRDLQIAEDEVAFMHSQLFAASVWPIFSCSGDICAKGMYVGISTLKPSCDPDVKCFSDGAEMVIRALKPGLNTTMPLQLTLDYMGSNGLKTTRERRAYLAENYYRKCNCKLCLDVNRDAEMRSMRCRHCSEMTVPVLDDPKKTTAKCPSCGRQNDATEAIQLMKTIEPIFANEVIEKMRACAKQLSTEKGKKEMKAFIEQARVVLSPVNAYAARLYFYYGGEYLSIIGDKHAGWLFFLMAWAGYERFDAPFRMNRVLLMRDIGQNCLMKPGDLEEKKKGIRLFLQAASFFKLYNYKDAVDHCLAKAAEGSREVALMEKK